MKKALATLLIAAASVAAQLPPVSAPPPSPPRRPRASRARRRGCRAPSYKDLKFPPLRPIQIPKVATFTLPNGMKLYLLEDHELPIINGVAQVRTGNLFDPADKIGLAAMTGMVMRTGGTRTKTGDQLDEQLENIAASVESGIGETSGSGLVFHVEGEHRRSAGHFQGRSHRPRVPPGQDRPGEDAVARRHRPP